MVVQIVNRRAFLKVAGVCTLFPSVLLGSQAALTQTGPENGMQPFWLQPTRSIARPQMLACGL
jgi:hypothetical protein